MLWTLILCNFMANTLFMNVCSLLPQFVAINFPTLTNLLVGAVMGVYPIAYLLSAPFIGKYNPKVGRKNSLLIGIVITSVATLAFGLGGYCSTVTGFLILSVIARSF